MLLSIQGQDFRTTRQQSEIHNPARGEYPFWYRHSSAKCSMALEKCGSRSL